MIMIKNFFNELKLLVKNNSITIILSFLLYYLPLAIVFTLVFNRILNSEEVNKTFFIIFLVVYNILESFFMFSLVIFAKYSDTKLRLKYFFGFLYTKLYHYLVTITLLFALVLFGLLFFIAPGIFISMFIPFSLFSVFYLDKSGYDAVKSGYYIGVSNFFALLFFFLITNIVPFVNLFFIKQIFINRHFLIEMRLFFFLIIFLIGVFELIIYTLLATLFKVLKK